MESIRKSGYKVEPKPIPEKKRRKSELVVMWQSIWDVTISTLLEFYLNVLGLWEALRFYFNSNEQQEVRKWLIEYLPRVPNDFAESWRDGILLSILLNKLQPGCCPDAEYLDANYALRNLYHVFQLLEYHFNITPKCTVEEIITCSSGSDSKLLELLLQLKNETDTKADEINPLLYTKEREDESNNCSTSTNCVARGTGLMVGFVGRVANFIVFFASIADLDLVVEIKGPCETVCSERITKRSPKKKQILKPWIPTSPHNMVRSSSNEDRSTYLLKQASKSEIKDETRYIPLEYEVHSNRIYFAYMPLIKGQHQIKILSRGMHVSDSPYNVAVAPVGDSHKNSPIRSLKSSLKVENSFDCRESSKATTVRFQDTSERKERLGNIIKRRVLRYIVKIGNKDVVVDTNSIDNLATSLLKMDYDFQKPPLSRRNSWGFVGDAERKVSVIRQFCVNMDELEAQSVKLHRSQSISGGSGSNKIPFNRRGSCEDIPTSPQKKLETVKEGTVSHFETEAFRHSKTEEESLVYINEDFETNTEPIKNDEECDIVADKQISKTERAGDSIEFFFETTTQNGNIEVEENLFHRRKAKNTLNSLNDESETFTQMSSIRKPLDLLSSAREISSRLDDQTEEQTITMSNFDKIDQIIFSDLQLKENEDGIKRETKPSCYQIDFTPLTEGIISTEKYNEIRDIPKTNRIPLKSELRQKDYQISPENNFSDEVFIEEELCTKTDIQNANQAFQNKREISNRYCAVRTPMNSEKPEENSEGNLGKPEEHSICNKTQNCNTKETLKIQHKSKRIGRWYCKTNNPNRKINKKKIDENQRYFNSKVYRKQFEGLNQNTNIFSNMEECNEIRLKPAKKVMKMNNVFPSSNRKSMLTNNSNKASSIHDLKDSCTQTYVSYYQKRYRENPFFTNNLKDEGKPIPQLQAKKINIEFSKNNFKGKSSTQMPSLTQISEPKSDSNSIQDFSSTATSTSLTLCQLNFRHFNPTLPNKRISLVKDRINQWEENAGKEDVSPKSKHNSRIVSKSNITSTLNFWESVTKENKLEEEHEGTSGSSKSTEENATNIRPNTLTPSATKKLDGEFAAFRKTRRSASYPGTMKASIQNSLYTIQGEFESEPSGKELITEPNTSSPESMSQQVHQTSSAEYPSSASIFDNSTDDEDISVDLLDSTEDEYIDDEISESAASTYWGDISVMERLKSADADEYRDICRIVDGELWRHNGEDCAVDCQVFGIATYFGYVAVKNRFQVLTKGSGSGNLSATLQGFGRHDVSLVCVRYLQRDLYEVTYQVMSPGLYLISVRWMERPIAGSPFLCKVSF